MSTSKLDEALLKKGIDNDEKLRRFLPLHYYDYSHETGCVDGPATCTGIMLSCDNMKSKSNVPYILVRIKERISGQVIKGLIFNQKYAFKAYNEMCGKFVLIAGEMHGDGNSYTILGPKILTDQVNDNMKIAPIYSKVGASKTFFVKQKIDQAIITAETDSLPKELIKEKNLPSISWSLYELHHPASREALKRADNRLLYDDLFYFAACSEIQSRKSEATGIKLPKNKYYDTIIQNFGYELTPDQQKVYNEISEKISGGKLSKSLVQGDVGCGKTIVALLLMAQAVSCGYQACIMAPTQILAQQHYDKLCKLLPDQTDRIHLVSGGVLKKTDLNKINDGTYQYIIGTHAVLSDKIKMKDLALVIIDEEHKFGVEQRTKLESLTSGIHCISMTATPIPRTLAAAIYGDSTDIYSIHSKPEGRSPVYTTYDDGQKADRYIQNALDRNEQIYIVCPAIDTDDDKMPGVLNVNDAEQLYKKLLPHARIGVLHGKLSQAKTEEVLQGFKDHALDILISTTVVEVGVDVPNATLILIHNAERFGLAGMHQLRGRVGRSDKPSCCVLISKEPNDRINTLCQTTDGFKIAEADLSFRKSGAIFGTAQSGFNVLTEEILNNPDLYIELKTEVKKYSKVILNRHIKKMNDCTNPKRRNLYGKGGRVEEFCGI